MLAITVLTIVGGGLNLAGIAYPSYAAAKGWPIGSSAYGGAWSLWFFMGSLAYLAGMFATWGWWGILAAIPVAFIIGLAFTVILGKRVQLFAYLGPIFANLWYVTL